MPAVHFSHSEKSNFVLMNYKLILYSVGVSSAGGKQSSRTYDAAAGEGGLLHIK